MRCSAVTVTLCAVCACGERSDPPATEPAIRVENGVTIVENPGLHLADARAWSVDAGKAVRIGVVDGPDEYVIGRLAGMLRLPDGNILIADAMAHELRVFDARGRFVRKVGRAGEGPGEYGLLTQILDYAGDSIVVIDNEGSRATVLDPTLGFVRRYHPRLTETRARQPFTSHQVEGFFADGRALVSDFSSACDPRSERSFCEDSVAFYRTNEEGTTEARFGRFVHSRRQAFRVRPGVSTGWSEPHPQAMWVVRGDRFYYADAKRFEVQVYRSDGSLERIVRVAAAAPRYTKKDVWPAAPSTTGTGEAGRELRRVMQQAQDNATLPDTFPAFSDLLVDDAGNLWIREYLPPSKIREVPPRWFVFDAEGRLRRAIRARGLVSRFGLVRRGRPEIGSDYILTSARDPDGVESVVLYPLTKRR